MKWLLSLLVVLLLLLQYRLWRGDGGVAQVLHLQNEVAKQGQHKKQLEERNASLFAEVKDLKKGQDAIEERARSELGMIHKDEYFYQIIHTQETPDAPQ
ncbi:Cell division protein DivIC (FtsB), stabilizes FtsL against RasP cleavage [hydrothermal vent metagenome]|uniref:Cell division protein DivIC (FtsB), stabilizes FtsL against RasP cleavage n=1 Tax=hydrothermal vent metagenome TaxID=652676 RepID=A0A3B0XUB7_9ZZZZ